MWGNAQTGRGLPTNRCVFPMGKEGNPGDLNTRGRLKIQVLCRIQSHDRGNFYPERRSGKSETGGFPFPGCDNTVMISCVTGAIGQFQKSGSPRFVSRQQQCVSSHKEGYTNRGERLVRTKEPEQVPKAENPTCKCLRGFCFT